MSEEDKKAIKYIVFLSNEKCECEACQNAKKHYKIILNLLEKQQKEIKSLQQENSFLKQLYAGTDEFKSIERGIN